MTWRSRANKCAPYEVSYYPRTSGRLDFLRFGCWLGILQDFVSMFVTYQADVSVFQSRFADDHFAHFDALEASHQIGNGFCRARGVHQQGLLLLVLFDGNRIDERLHL